MTQATDVTVAAATKFVRITLGALTRVEYTEVLQVPVDATDEEIRTLADKRYDAVDGGLFAADEHYWERGETSHDVVAPGEFVPEAVRLVVRDDEGDLELQETPEPA